jgi:hypothetical protein
MNSTPGRQHADYYYFMSERQAIKKWLFQYVLIRILMVIAAVGIAALILGLGEVILITLPEMLIQTAKGNSAPLVPARQRSRDQNKTGSCPFR